MPWPIRLLLPVSACFLLTSCQLINTALRMAPLLLFAEKENQGQVELRGRMVEEKGTHEVTPPEHSSFRFAASEGENGGEGGIRTLGTAFDRTTL